MLNQEPGWQQVQLALQRTDTCISAVNYAEVYAKLIALGMTETLIDSILEPLGLQIIQIDEAMAKGSSLLYLLTKPKGLSLGDRICLALGQQVSGIVLTSDKVWASLSLLGLTIQVIR